MKLSILIATQGRRNDKFQTLLESLMRQVNSYKGEIEVIAYWNNGERPIGEIRQLLLEEAQGEYVCFVDDDDAVPPYYCKEIIKALGKDYVGFKVKFFSNGVEGLTAYHDLQYQIWVEDENGYYRGVTHLNPIKKSIAIRGHFTLNGAAEDADWAKSVLPFVKTQNYINKFMYFYYHSTEDSSFGGSAEIKSQVYERPTINYKHFRYHPASTTSGGGNVTVNN